MRPDSVSLEDLVVIAKYKIEQPELYHSLYCGWLERWGMFGRSNARCYRDDEEHIAGIRWKSEQDSLIPGRDRDTLSGWWYDGHY